MTKFYVFIYENCCSRKKSSQKIKKHNKLPENPVFEVEVKYPKKNVFMGHLTPPVFFFSKIHFARKLMFYIPGQITKKKFTFLEKIISFDLGFKIEFSSKVKFLQKKH